VPGHDDLVGRPVEAAVALVMRRITKEDTQGGAGSEFVGSSGREVGIARATKDTDMLIGWLRSGKDQVRCGKIECLGGKNVKEKGSSVQHLNPVNRWDPSLKK